MAAIPIRPFIAATLLVVIGMTGCTTPTPVGPAKTTVVLIPDEDGNVGAVTLATERGSRRIDAAYSVATVEGTGTPPTGPRPLGRAAVDSAYGALLRAQPPKPKTFILHFLLDKTALTEESKAMIPAVLHAIRERRPTEITVFGHADASGTELHNLKLSSDRANAVARLLREADPSLDRIDVQHFGDRAPLFPTDGAPEPKNRRAEILVL